MPKFDFRDFSIDQSKSPLKVGTDAILLGASVEIPNEATRVLDVGTGTGVIAMILASRYLHIHVAAIEPNESAFQDATLNFSNATFSDRLSVANLTIQDLPQTELFDVVVSNPPFFIDDLKSTDLEKMQAKHIDEVAFFHFLDACLLHLKETGLFWIVLPKLLAERVCNYLLGKDYKVIGKTRFHSNVKKPDIRWVLAFSRKDNPLFTKGHSKVEQELVIRNTDGSFHQDYIDFAGYLHAKSL